MTGKAFGFRQLIAGQLLRLRIGRVFKGSLPEGEEPGERVILFIPSVKNTKAPFLKLLDDASLVTVPKNKGVGLPRRFLKTYADKSVAAASTADEVIAEIQKDLGKDVNP